jgi:Ser/Thr protein kinase RdoA (MazF antagonist)
MTRGLRGSPLSKSDRYGSNRINFGKKYGKSIAQLHKALKEVQNEVSPDEVNLYQSITGWALPNVRQQNIQWNMGLDEEFFKDYIDTFGKLFDKLPKQLIHRDPNPSNILFDNGEVSGFIDFDLSEVNIRLWDACYCATGILSESSDEVYEKWLDILGGILHGYDSEGKLSQEEKQAVFYVICSIQMVCVAYFESHEEFKQLAKTNRKMLMYIVNNKAQIKQMF